MWPWHSLVGLLSVLLVFGATQTRESASPRPLRPVALTIDVRATDVEISGVVSSVAHEAILHQTVLNLFPGKTAHYDLETRPALPAGWALITDLVLRALADTRSATAAVDETAITIRGITASRESWVKAAARIERNLLPGMRFRHQVQEIGSPGSMNRQCIELFRTALRGRKLEFRREDATLRSSQHALLDELIQIAADCPHSTVRISGHTDGTGDEVANRQLSQARADAVAAYMVAGGIAAERITAIGKGASKPLVAEDGARARQLNRRIEIELGFP